MTSVVPPAVDRGRVHPAGVAVALLGVAVEASSVLLPLIQRPPGFSDVRGNTLLRAGPEAEVLAAMFLSLAVATVLLIGVDWLAGRGHWSVPILGAVTACLALISIIGNGLVVVAEADAVERVASDGVPESAIASSPSLALYSALAGGVLVSVGGLIMLIRQHRTSTNAVSPDQARTATS